MSTQPFPILSGWLSLYNSALSSAGQYPDQQFKNNGGSMVTLIYQDKYGNQTDGFIELGNKWYNPTAAQSNYQNPISKQNPIPTDKACIIEITGNWYTNLSDRNRYMQSTHEYSNLSHKITHIHDDDDTQAKAVAFSHLISHFQQSIEHPDYNKWKDIITSLIQQQHSSILQTKVTCQIGIMTTTSNTSSIFTPLLLTTPKANNNDNNNNTTNTIDSAGNNQSQQQLYYGTTRTSISSTRGLVHPASCIVVAVVTYTNKILFSIPLCHTAPEKIIQHQLTEWSSKFDSPLDEAQIVAKWGDLLSSPIELLAFQQPDGENFATARAFVKNIILTPNNIFPQPMQWYSSHFNSLYKEAITLLNTTPEQTLFHNHPPCIQTSISTLRGIIDKWGKWSTKEEQLQYYQDLKYYTNQLSTMLKHGTTNESIDEFVLYDYLDELPNAINQRITSLATQHDVQYYKTLYSYYGRQRQHIAQPTQDCIDLALAGHRGLINTVSIPSQTANNQISNGNKMLPNNTINSTATATDSSSYHKHHSNILKQQIEMLHKQISFFQQELSKKDESLKKKDEALKNKDQQFAKKDESLEKKDQALTAKYQQIAETLSSATTTSPQASDDNNTNDDNNNNRSSFFKEQFLLLQQQLAQKDQQLARKDQQLVDALAKKDETLALKDQQLAEVHKDYSLQLQAKDQQIMQLMQMLMQQQQQQQQQQQFTDNQ